MDQNRRYELHKKLVDILGSNNCYFQPPEDLALAYPCIIYKLDSVDVKHADNKLYRATKRYSVTIIDEDPDTAIPDKVAEFPLCSFDRSYTADELNHYVYKIYY